MASGYNRHDQQRNFFQDLYLFKIYSKANLEAVS